MCSVISGAGTMSECIQSQPLPPLVHNIDAFVVHEYAYAYIKAVHTVDCNTHLTQGEVIIALDGSGGAKEPDGTEGVASLSFAVLEVTTSGH
eukprot:2354729-Karenia_brevis.AAC.1